MEKIKSEAKNVASKKSDNRKVAEHEEKGDINTAFEIELDLTKNVDENASVYFEKAKKAKKKLEGVESAIAQSKKKIEELELQRDEEIKKLEAEELAEEKKKAIKKEWYEKFRWFFSSEGFLCVGGRDATTNDIIIKKHADKDDVVFHTDMAGSPFFVIKNPEGKKIGEDTLQETADATASFSRAWKMGLGTSAVFYVKPEQVTKEAQSGEYLGKGAFMIRGKTNYVQPNMEITVSVDDKSRIICAAKSAILVNKADFAKMIILKQGQKKPSDIAKSIKKELACDNSLDEIIRMIPPGNCEIIKERKR